MADIKRRAISRNEKITAKPYGLAVIFPNSALSLDGGDEGDRTPYLLNAIQALSQVSYAPMCEGHYSIFNAIHPGAKLWGGLAYTLRSQVSYAPNYEQPGNNYIVHYKNVTVFTVPNNIIKRESCCQHLWVQNRRVS